MNIFLENHEKSRKNKVSKILKISKISNQAFRGEMIFCEFQKIWISKFSIFFSTMKKNHPDFFYNLDYVSGVIRNTLEVVL